MDWIQNLSKTIEYIEQPQLQPETHTLCLNCNNDAVVEKTGYGAASYNACVHRPNCTKNHVCKGDCGRKSVKYCKLCGRCNDFCPDFEEQTCIIRMKPPYVCNGCEERNHCTLGKTLYSAVTAQKTADQNISESRRGVLAAEQELVVLNELVTPLILQGHSVHQIYTNNVDSLMCSEKTLYNYIDNGFFDARNIDLPRKVRYRPRKKKKEFKVDKGCYIGRNYLNYQDFMHKHLEFHTVQMDSVIGTVGGKVLLTIHFPDTGFMLAFLRISNTSQSVIDIFDRLYITLGRKLFEKLFPVLLTDRGSEFSNPAALERSPDGIMRTRVFYCDPNAPFQKGSLEVNHSLIRRILPKGTSFDNLEQADIDRMMNHINSYRRKKLGNKTPFEVFEFYYGKEFFEKLGYEPIPSNNIIITPKLLKR